MPDQIEQWKELAIELAHLSEPVISKHFRTSVENENKLDDSPVTIADRDAERVMRDRLEQLCPDHGIYGEEYGRKSTQSDYEWILDPIDGTKAFLAGLPNFGTLIALCHKGEPIIGVIHQPIMRDLWVGVKGKKTLLNGSAIHVSDIKQLNQAILFSSGPEYFDKEQLIAFNQLEEKCRYRRYGTDCIGYGLLSAGHSGLVVEASLNPYDIMSMRPIVEGAGGIITNWGQEKLTIDNASKVIAAATPELHQAALEFFKDLA